MRPGDDIIAINDVPIARRSCRSRSKGSRGRTTRQTPITPLSRRSSRGTEPVDLDIRLRARDGTVRDYRVRTGENHIEQAASRVGLSPMLLSVVDLLHVITYPFLLFAAWILHRRKREDLTSSILSLAILLTIASEQPSAAFLRDVIQVPDWASSAALRSRQHRPACRRSCCSPTVASVRASCSASSRCCPCCSSSRATPTG